MSETAPETGVETTPPAATAAPGGSGLTDDHAQALLADALKIAEQENGTAEAGKKPESQPGTLPDDPEALRAEITRLRRENGAARTNAKAQAADEARADFAQQIGKILGLIPDEATELDPAALTEQLTNSQAATRQAQVELAVFRAAAGTDADPSALLDSRSFLEKVAALDPGDGDAITAAIADAIGSNPRLGKAPTPGMKPNPAQGRSASPPLGMADQIAAAQQAGDIKTVMRLKASMALASGDHSTS